jgi:hypothetical protein
MFGPSGIELAEVFEGKIYHRKSVNSSKREDVQSTSFSLLSIDLHTERGFEARQAKAWL